MRLEALRSGAFDLLVVGGGINGAGIAREAARCGWRVALVEKLDYGSGTTSRSTRLIHGGIRYLEQAEIMLVLESLRERERLLRTKPHLVRPLRFIIPVYSHSSRSPLVIRAGMLLYDLLSAGKSVPSHRAIGRNELRELESQLQATGVKGAFLYYDGQVNFPERLVMETVTDARRHGAVACNHCELRDFRITNGKVRGAVVRDVLSGEQAEVEAEFTVNATGPWLEQLDALLPARRAHPLLAPTRGTHLAMARFPGAPDDGLYFEARSDRRPMFMIPWHGLLLIGTTEEPFRGDPGGVRPSPEEIDYLLRETNLALPRAALTRESILFTYAGVRALPFEEAAAPGELTRRHIFFDHEQEDGIQGLATIVGGKLTTYRSLAEDVVKKAARKLGRQAAHREAEPAGPEFIAWPWHTTPESLAQRVAPVAAQHGLPTADFIRLFETYGAGAHEILRLMKEDPLLRAPVCGDGPLLCGEVIHAARVEQALTIGDVLLRRSCAALAPDRGMAAAPGVADLLAKECKWDTKEREAALTAYHDEIERTLIKSDEL